MLTNRDRREAAEILRRIVENLPEPTPVQVALRLGQASALDPAGGGGGLIIKLPKQALKKQP